MRRETATTPPGVCRPEADEILRAPSLLPLDLISATRREGVSVWVIELKVAIFAPHAHPKPKASNESACDQNNGALLISCLGFNNANTSS